MWAVPATIIIVSATSLCRCRPLPLLLQVLEPRRVAAKAAARRMSSLLGEAVGQTVGYRVRLESRISRGTRVEVVTEGILLRMLQEDPTLEVGRLLRLSDMRLAQHSHRCNSNMRNQHASCGYQHACMHPLWLIFWTYCNRETAASSNGQAGSACSVMTLCYCCVSACAGCWSCPP